MSAGYKFTNTWFAGHVAMWQKIKEFKGWGQQPLTVVEIGSFEGQSSCWIADNLLQHPASKLYCIDTFQGSVEHATDEKEGLYERFLYNIDCTNKLNQIEVMVGFSSSELPKLMTRNIQADLIYVDGSHYAKDVLSDAVLSWHLLKPQGVMIFDDYLWFMDKHDIHVNPKIGIDNFINTYFQELQILNIGYQMYIMKN